MNAVRSFVHFQYIFRPLLLRFLFFELVVHLINNCVYITVNVLVGFDTLGMLIRPNMLLILPFMIVLVANHTGSVLRVRNGGLDLLAVELFLSHTFLTSQVVLLDVGIIVL